MITLDTSGLIAYIAVKDPNHEPVMEVMLHDPGPYVIPVGALAEMTFMIERDFPSEVEHTFIADLRDRAYVPDWTPRDLNRIEALVRRYADLPLGFADAAVVACAERHGGRVLTLDRRDFEVVAGGEGTIYPLPQ